MNKLSVIGLGGVIITIIGISSSSLELQIIGLGIISFVLGILSNYKKSSNSKESEE